jgi:NAD(P)-dependent dehydrogenase (short-subunit alcohol dehydrogenase family)
MRRLAGKVAFITGAASGIGRASAQLFAREGAKVAVADVALEAAQLVAQGIAASSGEAFAVHTDVTDEQSVERALKATMSRYGDVHVIYNNAGGSSLADGPATTVAIEEFWRVLRVDLFGTFLVCRLGIPYLAKSGGGSIINATSIVAMKGIPGMDCYTAAKGGIASLTRSLAVNYATQKVRVNAVCPGYIATERAVRMAAAKTTNAGFLARQPLGAGHPDDVAHAALYLASDDARLITGSIMYVDGGFAVA